MSRRSLRWLAVAVLFALLNAAGAAFAAVQREPVHAGMHVVLVLLGAFVVWGLVARRPVRTRPDVDALALGDRLARLEQSVDAVAIEVERIGEGQRFMTRAFTERVAGSAPADGDTQEAAPRARRS